jgi:hypothetical protein
MQLGNADDHKVEVKKESTGRRWIEYYTRRLTYDHRPAAPEIMVAAANAGLTPADIIGPSASNRDKEGGGKH